MSDSRKFFQPDVLKAITPLELRARQVVNGFLSGMHRSRYRGFSVEFASHRLYAPGDDLRHIDWRAFGRLDKPFIKEHEVETNMRVHLLLDGSESMAYPEHARDGRMTKWDYAATVAASLAHLLVGQQDSVGLTLFDEDVVNVAPPSTRKASLSGLIGSIAEHRPQRRTQARVVLDELSGRARGRGMVILLSDLLTDVDELIAGLRRLRFSGQELLVLHILDHDELEFPFLDRTQFVGMEDASLDVLADPQSLRSAYLEALHRFLTRVRGECVNQRIDYALFNTSDPLDIVLTRFLARRRGAR
ncbi:MAG: hypothetical protein BroJett003_05060 [Planctomycetota bacterium]|nr:MAG: hypothetical protein BroJett003_05060 [Planctomycetota bacterium]